MGLIITEDIDTDMIDIEDYLYVVKIYNCWMFTKKAKYLKNNIENWLRDNIQDEYYISSLSWSEDATFHFKNINDAIHMKLVWC